MKNPNRVKHKLMQFVEGVDKLDMEKLLLLSAEYDEI